MLRRYIAIFFIALLLAAPPCLAKPGTTSPELKAHQLYRQGRFKEARNSFEEHLEQTRRKNQPEELWKSLMAIAWFEDEVGQHRKSIEYSNEAFEIAVKANSPYMLGRSLCWLGWAYSHLGLYTLALDFYREAVAIGAPDGKIQIIPVWGLATQEIGAIYFKMGDTANALEALRTTTAFGKEHGIDIALAEGDAHLAEIYLHTGEYENAEMRARSALDAAKRCDCSPYNRSRAHVVQAKVHLYRAQRNPSYMKAAREQVIEIMEEVKAAGHERAIAETKIILAKLLPKEEFNRRHQLIADAFVTLSNQESELRGIAEAEFGRLYVERNSIELAKFYVQNGIKINAAMFRKVDDAYLASIVADIKLLEERTRTAVEDLIKSFDAAMSSNALPQALSYGKRIISALERSENWKLAHDWAKKTLNVCNQLIDSTTQAGFSLPDSDLQDDLTMLREKKMELQLKVRSWM